jgi:hypothetical protein
VALESLTSFRSVRGPPVRYLGQGSMTDQASGGPPSTPRDISLDSTPGIDQSDQDYDCNPVEASGGPSTSTGNILSDFSHLFDQDDQNFDFSLVQASGDPSTSPGNFSLDFSHVIDLDKQPYGKDVIDETWSSGITTGIPDRFRDQTALQAS